MLGRLVGERLEADPAAMLITDDLTTIIREADAFVLNLECAISDRGTRWPDPIKPFFFRAPPVAVDVLAGLGVVGVTDHPAAFAAGPTHPVPVRRSSCATLDDRIVIEWHADESSRVNPGE